MARPPLTQTNMSITIDKKIATGLLNKAKTGNELLSIVDMITDSFNYAKQALPTPTLEEIEF